jgi:putative transposase
MLIDRRYDKSFTGELPPIPHLSEVVRAWKSMSARKINQETGAEGQPVWQRGYVDRVIRGDADPEKFRAYILTNPLRYTLRKRSEGRRVGNPPPPKED